MEKDLKRKCFKGPF